MVDLASMPVEPQEIIDFLGRDLQLKAVCQDIVCQHIIHRTAQSSGIIVTSEEIQAEVDRSRHIMQLNSHSALISWLRAQMISLQEWQTSIRDRLLVEKLAEHLFAEPAKEFFGQHQKEFDQILLYKITVPYESLALELFYQIEEEEMSFYEAAHLYNVSERGRLHCGCEGKRYRRELKPEISELIFETEIGQVCGPIPTAESTYNLLMVEEFIPAEFTESIRQSIIQQMFQEWLSNQWTLY